MLTLKGGIALDPSGEIPAVAEIVCFVVEADLIADFPLFGLHVKPWGIFEVKYFQVL
jgi:hypothetical protein